VNEATKIFVGHTGPVSCIQWPTIHQIMSGGYDKTIRIWDVEAGLPDLINTPTIVYSVSYTAIAGLIATSHADKIIRIWDPRAPNGKTIQHSFASHKAWTSGVAWHPRTPYPQFASCSHDGTVKVWDLRSSMPLFSLPSHTDRALCVDWAGVNVHTNKENGNLESTTIENGKDEGQARFDVVSGGADNKLRVWRCDL